MTHFGILLYCLGSETNILLRVVLKPTLGQFLDCFLLQSFLELLLLHQTVDEDLLLSCLDLHLSGPHLFSFQFKLLAEHVEVAKFLVECLASNLLGS